jgi:glycosyltransferase involved in cell wall biosynthesis
MLASHNLLGTWHSKVTLFVALTDFARDRFIRGGLPSDRIVVRPNFVTDQGVGEGAGNYILYVGRLSVEKGIPMLLRAWRAVKTGKLIIVGEGPLEGMVRDEARLSQGVSYIGRQPAAKVRELMSNAVALAFPSLWYEGLPGVMIEAFSHGTPVVANRLGAMEHLVRHTQTGWLVEPGAEAEFAAALINAQERPQDNVGMRAQARAEFESKYNAERGYELLMSTYARAFALNEQRG